MTGHIAGSRPQKQSWVLPARTVSEPAALTTDLPTVVGGLSGVPPQARALVEIDRRGGSVTRTGRWAVPEQMRIRSSYSKMKLDSTEAVITQEMLRIEMTAKGGSLTLITGPGIVVDTDDLQVD